MTNTLPGVGELNVVCPKCSAELRVEVIFAALPGGSAEPACPECGCAEFYRKGLIGPVPYEGPVTVRLHSVNRPVPVGPPRLFLLQRDLGAASTLAEPGLPEGAELVRVEVHASDTGNTAVLLVRCAEELGARMKWVPAEGA